MGNVFAFRRDECLRAKPLSRDVIHASEDARGATVARDAEIASDHPHRVARPDAAGASDSPRTTRPRRIGGMLLSVAVDSAGRSLAGVARAIGMTYQRLQKVERGELPLTVEMIDGMDDATKTEIIAGLAGRLPRGCTVTLADRLLEEAGVITRPVLARVLDAALRLPAAERAELVERLRAAEKEAR